MQNCLAQCVERATQTRNGHLFIGAGGARLYFDGMCLHIEKEAVVKRLALAAGLPIIDASAFDGSTRLKFTKGPQMFLFMTADNDTVDITEYAKYCASLGAKVLNVKGFDNNE